MTQQELETLAEEMFTQDKRSTSYVYFVVVEDKKVYGIDSDYADGSERKDYDSLERSDLCEKCKKIWDNGEELPDECDEYGCEDSFVTYRIDRDVPNLYAGIFFTSKACDEHIKNKAHHYNGTARSYGMSAVYNYQLRAVMDHLCPKGGLK